MSALRDALLRQKEELDTRLKQLYIHRDAAIHEINSDIIKVIMGPRRAGKSFFAMHILSRSGSFGYANFDDEVLADAKDYDEIITNINSIYGAPKFILFDEIQNLKKWELFVNRLQRPGCNLIITGSNSNLLSKELSTHLTGRHLVTNILPLSFKEVISAEQRELTKSEIKAKFFDYAMTGGYPEPFVKRLIHKEYLSTLFDSIIYKDIVKRYRIRKPRAIEELAEYLISNTAKEFSYNRLAEMTDSEGTHTIKKYIGYLEEAFILFEVARYSQKLREQVKYNKKIYCIDNGFIRAKAFSISQDKGRAYENLIAIELKRRASSTTSEFYYWKDQQHEEVEFVIKKGNKIHELIQVCVNLESPKASTREVRALLKASKDLKCNNLTVLTEDYEDEKKAEWFGIKRMVKFTPVWKWLLG